MTKCIKANVAAMALFAGPVTGTGIGNNVFSNAKKMNVYHFNNTICMIWPQNKAEGTIEIYNLEGRLMYKRAMTGNHKNSIKINSVDFANGVYQLKVTTGTQILSDKFAITR